MERVSLVHGKNPVILIAPHGNTDTYTDILTKAAAIECKGNAIVNHAWERSAKVDILKSEANCNNINHATHDVVKDEFLDPIFQKEFQLIKKHGEIFVFHVHGCGNNIAQLSGIKDLSFVLGYGKGPDGKSRPVCDSYHRDLFSLHAMRCLWVPAHAEAGSRFAGWDSDNLLQVWRPYRQFKQVHAMQLEFLTKTRISKKVAEATGIKLGLVINGFLKGIEENSTLSPFAYHKITI